MRTWIIRFASLYVFNVVVLLAIDLLMPQVRVGWAALWAAVVLTAATLWIKPVIEKALANAAASRAKSKLIEYGLAFVVALAVWILVAMFSGANVRGFFWGYLLPPIALMIAWTIYDAIDDRLESKAGELYDRAAAATGGRTSAAAPGDRRPAAAPDAPSPQQRAATASGERELKDGLTDEQRRMFDEL